LSEKELVIEDITKPIEEKKEVTNSSLLKHIKNLEDENKQEDVLAKTGPTKWKWASTSGKHSNRNSHWGNTLKSY
jgi:hypothetical protein